MKNQTPSQNNNNKTVVSDKPRVSSAYRRRKNRRVGRYSGTSVLKLF